jgi:PAS domain S-box-containing protein
LPDRDANVPFEFGKPARWARQMAGNSDIVWRYGIAVAAVLAATGIQFVFKPTVGVHLMDLSFALGVVVAARFGGRGPGLAAGALSAVIVNWLFVKRLHSLAITDETAKWEIGLFLVLAVPIALLVGSLRESLLARASAEEELRRQAQLIDLSHDAVITMDSQLRILTWNKGAEEMYGWPKQDAIGKVLPQLLQTAGPHSLREIDTVLRREGRWEGELSQKAHNGHRLDVDSRHVLFGGGNGLPPCILAISRNITQPSWPRRLCARAKHAWSSCSRRASWALGISI